MSVGERGNSSARAHLRAVVAASLFAITGAVSHTPAFAEAEFPSKPVRVIVPLPAGGGADLYARELSNELQKRLGQPFVVENKPGATSIVGLGLVAKAPADGYTIVVSSNSFSSIPALNDNLPFDILKDFSPISLGADLPGILVVNPSLEVENLSEFINLLKKSPGKYNYSSGGRGGATHLTTEYLLARTGISAVDVPTHGASQSIVDVVANRAQFGIVVLNSVLPYLQTGQLKAIGVISPKRTELAPDIPTLAEAGLAGFGLQWWVGVLAPAKTPKDIVARLSVTIEQISSDPAFRAKLGKAGQQIIGSSPDAFAKTISDDSSLYAKIVEDLKIEKKK